MGYQSSEKHQSGPPVDSHCNIILPSTSKLQRDGGMTTTASAAEIPIWINGIQRWISGISRKTTCDDVIRVLLRAEGVNVNDDRHTKHYAIVERWRKVERPLDGRARILKVWQAWGDEQSAVRLTLRRVNPTTPRDVKISHQKRSSATPPHYRARLLQTVHPKRLIQQSGDPSSVTDGIERLMKLILAQGETIHSQLRRLHERDEQIHKIEHKVHRDRVEKLGSNYLLETYLGSTEKGEEEEEKGDDSGVAEVGSGNGSAEVGTSPTEDIERRQRVRTRSRRSTSAAAAAAVTEYDEDDGAYCAADESSSDENIDSLVDLRSCIALYEKIIRVNKRLEKQEQYLVKLHVKLRRYSDTDEAARIESENITQESTLVIREQLEEAITLSNTQEQLIETNERAINDTSSQLESRHRLLDCLQEELQATEAEGAQLQYWLDAMSRAPPPIRPVETITTTRCTPHVVNKLVDSDSNSDTGLSSLHSSGEEGGYVLDTLV